MNPPGTSPPKPSLQAARKAFARAHISQAARELFYTEGYAETTFDKIASAAGTRRTTLYSHFRDKAEILEQIAEEYQSGLCKLVGALEGTPVPDREQIAAWVAVLVDFVERQRAPATLVIGLSIGQDTPHAIQRTSERFPKALAERLPAFAKAWDGDEQHVHIKAWGKVVMRDLSLACLEVARGDAGSEHALTVSTDLFTWFVRKFA
jgi:AcrR family transcriptional regulator